MIPPLSRLEPTSRIQLSVSLVFDWPPGRLWWLSGKESAYNAGDLPEMQVQSLGQEDILEEGMATPSGILAWEIPWTEGPGGLQSMGLQRIERD